LQAHAPSGFRPGVVVHGGTELHYWTCGPADAPWLAICHGGALDHSGFVPIARALQDRWRVLLWDLPGHGRSQPRPEPFTVAGCVAAFDAVLTHAGVRHATLLGFSFGGVVAQLYAAQRPDVERGVVAYSCLAPQLLRLPIPAWSIRPFHWLVFGRLPWAKARAKFAALCSIRPDVRAALEPAIDALGEQGLAALVEAQYRLQAYDPSFRLNGPVLLMHGDRDPHLRGLARVIAAYRRAYPAAELAVIRDAGHCAHLDSPEAFTDALRGFLERIAGTEHGRSALQPQARSL
jgi:pimeloyl-ACP methyl ester carboxylesterase